MDSGRILIIGAHSEALRKVLMSLDSRIVCLDVPADSVGIVIHTKEEEMRSSLLAAVIAATLNGCSQSLSITQLGDFPMHALLNSGMREKVGFRGHVRHHRKKSVSMGNMLHSKLKIPRGIHRDRHGIAQIQKMTPARLTRRNGSRK